MRFFTGRAENDRLRASGVRRVVARSPGRRASADRAGLVRGIRKIGTRVCTRTADGSTTRLVTNYVADISSGLAAAEENLHPCFLTLADREMIADLHRVGRSFQGIGRALGRPAFTVKREIDTQSIDGE